jgi:uncharacterized protein with NRDE domain
MVSSENQKSRDYQRGTFVDRTPHDGLRRGERGVPWAVRAEGGCSLSRAGTSVRELVCTIALIHRLRSDHPLVVAANRDEFYARPASGPVVLDESHGVVGGRDHKGGTWMGFTRTGLFVGLTNQRTAQEPPPAARSRGDVVLRALAAGSVEASLDVIRGMNPREFPPFNLAIGDGERLVVAYARDRGWELEELGPGLYVLANDRLGSPWFPKADRLADALRPMITSSWDDLRAGLSHALGDTAVPEEVPLDPESPLPLEWVRALQALCIHTDVYGTRSATVAALGHGRTAEYLFADGPPDVTPFVDYTRLLSR